jgi:hypothetical protein
VIVHSALFAARLPTLFKRCLIVLSEDTGSGFTPLKAANADSLLKRSGLSPATLTNIPAVYGPTPILERSFGQCACVNLSNCLSNSLSLFDSVIQRLDNNFNVIVNDSNNSLSSDFFILEQPLAHS